MEGELGESLTGLGSTGLTDVEGPSMAVGWCATDSLVCGEGRLILKGGDMFGLPLDADKRLMSI